MSRILIVDDDKALLQSVERLLRAEGFVPTSVSHAHAALQTLEKERFDCVLLDISMPGMDGLACCRRIRETSYVPIVLLTARGDTMDKILGLELGADDYVTKPFNPRELVARIRAVLRGRTEYSSQAGGPSSVAIGEICVDASKHEVTVSGKVVALTHREYAILLYLAERVGKAVPRDQLFEEVWGYEADLSGKLLDVYIRRIRRKIEPDPETPVYIQTVRGFGYKLVIPELVAA